MYEQQAQQLIDAFYQALGLMQLERCQELLQELEELAQQEPAYQGWCTLFTGLLANYRDRDWAEGERLFQSLLQTDPEPALRGRVLISLGVTYRHQGRWHEAMKAYEQCLAVFSRPAQAVDRAKVWKNMAIVLDLGFSQGEYGHDALPQAVFYCQSALAILQDLKHPNDDELWLEATTWNTLGLVYRSLGDWPQATRCFERRIALGHALDDDYGIGAASHNLGEVLQHQGPAQWPEAKEAYLEALEIYRKSHDQYNEIDVLANLAFLHQEMGDYQAALDYYSQAIQLIEGLRAGVSAEGARADFFATIVDTYANAMLLCLEMDRQAQAFDFVERASSRAFLDVLAAGASGPNLSREVEAKTITLDEVQNALPADALLLEYFTTGLEEARLDPMARQQGVQRHRFPPSRTWVFAITRDEIQVHNANFSPNDLRPGHLDSVVERHFLEPQIRRTLYERLIAPAEKLLRGKRQLYLVPHGPLHYIPFQTLIAADGDTLLRERGPQLVYAPSATLLFRDGREGPDQALAPCLALGYNDQGKRALRFAEEEARSIAQVTGGRALAGPSSKKEDLYSQAENYRLLHFSCHGTFDPEMPLDSALCLGLDEALTALDVMECLRLRCDLVTLSACESGLSRVRRGDELVGFMRAFMVAGAPALVSTLWRVDERSTRILMERFYREIQDGVGFAEALKQAQIYLRDLTRQEAVNVLARFLADEILDSGMPSGESRSNVPAAEVTLEQADAYLKGIATKGGGGEVGITQGKKVEEKIFADPYYWAPFILIGDHRSVS